MQGWEASWQLRQGCWRSRTQKNWQRTRNRVRAEPSQGEAFVGVAGRSAAARADAPLGDAASPLSASLQWQAVGPRFANVENTLALPGHSQWDAGLQWLMTALQVNATLRNAFNRDYVATITALDNVYQGCGAACGWG